MPCIVYKNKKGSDMKQLTSLFFTAFCLLSILNASEPLLNNPQPTTISIGTATVEITRDDVSQAAIDLSHLKFCSMMCVTLWAMHFATCCSEYGQTEYLKFLSGYSSSQTFDLALKYYNLNWLPEKLTLSNLMPYATLVTITGLSIVVDRYDLHCFTYPVATFCAGVWLSFLLELRKKIIAMPMQHQNATKNN